MRLAFAGTPPFAATALAAIHAAGHEIALVLTQPDRPSGRGMRLAPSAVAQAAAAQGLQVLKPASLKGADALAGLRAAAPELIVVAAYGLILPRAILDLPPRGCLNIHASLLPRWRGAAPIQRALLAGDARTGISIMRMDEGLDTGAVLYQAECTIGPRETAGSLTIALGALGAQCIVHGLEALDDLVAVPQEDARATFAPKISNIEVRIDWNRPSAFIDRQVRAFDPAPGAETRLGETILKIREAEPTEGTGSPGRVLEAADSLVIACGQGALRIRRLQRAGGKPVAAADFLRGNPVSLGATLGSAPSPA